MFPLEAFYNSCCGSEPPSRKARLERKLKFLKWMKDSLETRLSAVNAAIGTVERQVNEEDSTNTTASA
ncbi:MAG: hypothetical protein WCA07_14440 [Gloeobacterales cyanobacterium]